jgi:RNA polymerase sigma factor (sigma-70 family)
LKKSSSDIISQLQSNLRQEREHAMDELYKASFPLIKGLVTKNGGNNEDALDVFHESLVVLYQNIISRKFNNESSVTTYLYAIGRNVWYKKLSKEKRVYTIDFDSNEHAQLDEQIPVEYDHDKLKSVLNGLNVGCRELLKAFYFDKKPLRILKLEFGLGSEQAIKNKKLRCMKTLMEHVKNLNLTIEDLIK